MTLWPRFITLFSRRSDNAEQGTDSPARPLARRGRAGVVLPTDDQEPLASLRDKNHRALVHRCHHYTSQSVEPPLHPPHAVARYATPLH